MFLRQSFMVRHGTKFMCRDREATGDASLEAYTRRRRRGQVGTQIIAMQVQPHCLISAPAQYYRVAAFDTDCRGTSLDATLNHADIELAFRRRRTQQREAHKHGCGASPDRAHRKPAK